MKEIAVSPYTDAVHGVTCPTCQARPGGYCSDFEPKLKYRYVVAPHPLRVRAAGFRIVQHPVDPGVRWYEPIGGR